MLDTDFAPARRADPDTLEQQQAGFLGVSVGQSMLEAMPGPAMVLNEDRQILCVNSHLLQMVAMEDINRLLGQRPGEALGCVNLLSAPGNLVGCQHARCAPGGCGTTAACAHCGAVEAIQESLQTRGRVARECRITTTGGGSLDLRVHATYLDIDGEDYVIVGLQDIGHEKRRQVLERAFFHDLLNTCGGLQGLAELLLDLEDDPQTEAAFKRDLAQISRMVVEEIKAHQQMLAAERGELRPALDEIDLPVFLPELVTLYRNHVVRGRQQLVLTAPPASRLRTDASLLRRVLGNLIKNAIEATDDDATIALSATVDAGQVVFRVHNPGVIEPAVQMQIFQRSFSTKSGGGRGVGTYAARLFVEGFLGGKVAFMSDEATGTEFSVTLPLPR